MFKLDNNFLIELGLGDLPPAEKNKMLAHIYETLEMRVGMKLAEQMSNEQLDEFEGYIKNQDEAGALKWLETNFPDYKNVVAQELEKLKGEIKQVAPQIVAQAQQAYANMAQQPQQGPAPAGVPPQQFGPAPQQQMPPQQPQQYGPAPAPQQPPVNPSMAQSVPPAGAQPQQFGPAPQAQPQQMPPQPQQFTQTQQQQPPAANPSAPQNPMQQPPEQAEDTPPTLQDVL